ETQLPVRGHNRPIYARELGKVHCQWHRLRRLLPARIHCCQPLAKPGYVSVRPDIELCGSL
ncbi:hypothetical protein H4R20_005798, partial [Coemansia guatemalensis]